MTSVPGTGKHSVRYQRRKVNTNPATAPVYNDDFRTRSAGLIVEKELRVQHGDEQAAGKESLGLT